MPNVIRIIKQKEPDKKRVVIYAFLTMVGSGRIADTAYGFQSGGEPSGKK